MKLKDRILAVLRPARADLGGGAGLLWALASVVIAGSIAWLLNERSALGSPYPILLIAVLMSCYFAGARAGLAAALFGGLAGQALAAFRGFHATDFNDITLFGLASIATIGLTAVAIRRARAARVAEQGEAAALSSAAITHRELDLLIDSATHFAICLLDPAGRVVVWNFGAERLFGWSEAEVTDRSHELFYLPEDREIGQPEANLTLARSEGRCAQRRWHARKDGSSFLADVTITRIDAPDGRLLGFGKVVRDVTQEQADADAVEAREAYLHTILATVPDAMIVTDEHGIVLSFSPTAEALFGYSETEMVGCNVSLLMPSQIRNNHDHYLARYRSTGQRKIIGEARRVIGRRKDGTTFPHIVTIAEVKGGGQRLFIGFIRDLSAREETEARLQELQAELVHISRISAIGTMTTTLAHELNQPLTAVTNYVQTAAALLEGIAKEPEATVHEALVEAGSEALRAGAIVRRLREFVSRGELDRTIEPVEPLIEDAEALGMVGARLKGIRVETHIADGVGAALIDHVQIQQVLVNLIRNAVEAIPAAADGLIRIIVEQQGDMLRFTITDNGPGLTPAIAATIFDAFVSTKARGMGLGLSICRTIVEAHGGRIWCDSLPEGGTAFHFTVPAAGLEPNDD